MTTRRGHDREFSRAQLRLRQGVPRFRPRYRTRVHHHRWMPEIGGLELVRSLKKLKVDLPVIVITGHSDVPLAVEAMKAGAVDFIQKPYEGEVLLGAALGAFCPEGGPEAGWRAGPRSRNGWRRFPRANGRCWIGSSRAIITRRVRVNSESALVRRDLSRQRHDQDAGDEPFAACAHGFDKVATITIALRMQTGTKTYRRPRAA